MAWSPDVRLPSHQTRHQTRHHTRH